MPWRIRASPLPRPANRDGARSRRQSQPQAGRRPLRSSALRRLPGPLGDAAQVDINGTKVAITTDSFVVKPLTFPGGSIGELAVNGTVNDLAVSGAKAEALVVTYVLEAGLPTSVLEAEVRAMAQAARDAGVRIAGGDTKVVEHGKADQMYITTTGIGRLLPGVRSILARCA
jgi:hydrogenase expression/formation protein HypE